MNLLIIAMNSIICCRLIHLACTLVFHITIMRDMEKMAGWLRLSIIYIFSGIGGYLYSAILLPYQAEVIDFCCWCVFYQHFTGNFFSISIVNRCRLLLDQTGLAYCPFDYLSVLFPNSISPVLKRNKYEWNHSVLPFFRSPSTNLCAF